MTTQKIKFDDQTAVSRGRNTSFNDIQIGKRYTEEGAPKTVYMVLSKNEKRQNVDVIRLKDYNTFSFDTLWMKFEEYEEPIYKNYDEEVTVLLFEDKSLIVNPSGGHLQYAYGKHRVFKARLTEIL
jgi:hypothetical protein